MMNIYDCNLGIVFVLVLCWNQGKNYSERLDESRPEPVLFLLAAADAMEQYRQAHGEYAKAWNQLDISFANGPYRANDPGTRPTEKDGVRWRPKGCEFTYWIASAGTKHYLVQARRGDGPAEYEIVPGMSAPKKLITENDLCTIERSKDKVLPESVMFLNAAYTEFQKYRLLHARYPQSWSLLNFHWALTPHRATDPDVRVPKDGGPTWRPRGGHFTYIIVQADANSFEIRSANGEGLENYSISSAHSFPTPLNAQN